MERLTERNPMWIDEEFWITAEEPGDEEIDAVYRKLKTYEDAEEQGLLVKLPCKVGDTVYEVTKGLSIFSGTAIYIHETIVSSVMQIVRWIIDGDFGKTVFLTREEAEAALKEANRNG